MNADTFSDIKKAILNEFWKKSELTQENISILDFANVDLMDDVLEIDFMMQNDQKRYHFWHDYHLQVGSITTKVEKGDQSEVIKTWGDWSVLG